jgi:hypothetical protein
MIKKILLAFAAVLILIQFIRPAKNTSGTVITENDISKAVAIDDKLHQTLIKKCYDCHSNNTNYPWYNNIQPVAWWLAHHIEEAKGELNFSEFKTYEQKKATHKLEEIGEVTAEGEMPLRSYTMMHEGTVITPDDKAAIDSWLAALNIEYKKEH